MISQEKVSLWTERQYFTEQQISTLTRCENKPSPRDWLIPLQCVSKRRSWLCCEFFWHTHATEKKVLIPWHTHRWPKKTTTICTCANHDVESFVLLWFETIIRKFQYFGSQHPNFMIGNLTSPFGLQNTSLLKCWRARTGAAFDWRLFPPEFGSKAQIWPGNWNWERGIKRHDYLCSTAAL